MVDEVPRHMLRAVESGPCLMLLTSEEGGWHAEVDGSCRAAQRVP